MKTLLAFALIAALTTPSFASGDKPEWDSIENLSKESRAITVKGQELGLRNVGGNTAACLAPRQLVINKNKCKILENGGWRCKFDCR